MRNEFGGHRIQRIPPTEKRGRVHTSTVTVAVMDELDTSNKDYDDSDFEIRWFSGSGSGGQHRNKTQNCCQLTHITTGLKESRQGRERNRNYTQAKTALIDKINQNKLKEKKQSQSKERSQQVGSGMRGDKTFTIRFQDDIAVRHSTGKRMKAKDFMNGHMDKLWD